MPPTSGNGKICYLQIPAVDVNVASAFYAAVFGWNIRRRDNGEVSFDDGVGEVSGMWVTDRPVSSQPNAGILISVMVNDIDAASALIQSQGGNIIEPVDHNRSELTATFTDPSGNAMGIYQERS